MIGQYPTPLRPGALTRFARLFTVGLLGMVLVLTVGSRPSPYAVVKPGTVLEIGSRIELPRQRQHETGWLALTTVRVGRATYASWLRAQLDPRASVVPTASADQPRLSQSEQQAMLSRWTESSKATAAVVALRAAGYPVQVGGRGVLVDGVPDESALYGLLRPGDVIVGLDSRPVGNIAELVAAVEAVAASDGARVEILRESQRQAINLPPRESGWELGDIFCTDYVFDVELPFPVEVESGDVLGDSAGLMLSLSLLDALTPGDLAGGRRVAGTGTIGLDGRVGPIAGVDQKVLAAELAGAEVFLAPRENAEEARRAASRLRVVAVGSFEEAVEAVGGDE